jgi:hypothetical protein
MNQFQGVVSERSLAACMRAASFADEGAKAVERLPFIIRRIHTDEAMWKEGGAGRAADARQLGSERLAAPGMRGHRAGTVVLLAESRLDGSTLGSIRICNNFYQALGVEASIVLPEWLQGRRLAEVTRLCVNEGRSGRLVKAALLKALVVYCRDNQIEWALATEGAADDGQYERLLFVDLFAGKQAVPSRHGRAIPQRVMACDIDTMEARFAAAKHPMLGFFCRTHHPDIDLSDPFEPGRAADARRSPNPVRRAMDVLEMA